MPLINVTTAKKTDTNNRLNWYPKDVIIELKLLVIEVACSPVLSSRKSVIGATATTTIAFVIA